MMASVISPQESRIKWLLSKIVEENGFPDEKATAKELKDIMEDIPSHNSLNILSEIYMSYPTISF